MMSRLTTIALLALVGTLLVFLFPAAFGPFTATHGPATAFRAVAAMKKLLMLLGSYSLIVLLQMPAFSSIAAQIPGSCAGHDLSPFNLRC